MAEEKVTGTEWVIAWPEMIASYIADKTYEESSPPELPITKEEYKREIMILLEHNDDAIEFAGLAYISESDLEEPGYYILFNDTTNDDAENVLTISVNTMLSVSYDEFLIRSGLLKKEEGNESMD